LYCFNEFCQERFRENDIHPSFETGTLNDKRAHSKINRFV